jgi:hypothetical protein
MSGLYDTARERLQTTFPDGTTVEGRALEFVETVVTYIERGAPARRDARRGAPVGRAAVARRRTPVRLDD